MTTQNEYYYDDLFEQVKAGNEQAFAQLHQEYQFRLFYFVNRLIDNPQVSEEIVSDTLLKLWALRTNFPSFNSAKTFLYVTSRNSSYDHLRHVNTTKYKAEIRVDSFSNLENEDIDEDALHKMIRNEVLMTIFKSIENLPPQRKAIIKLLYIDGMTTDEVAKSLGISQDTVRVAKFKALKELRNNTLLRKIVSLLLAIFSGLNGAGN
jgi:RNA polymerase sigma-70 factor (ECF subfamily)